MRRRTSVAGLLASFLACPLLALATPPLEQAPAAERLPVRGYTVDDGLAGDEINQILQQSTGFLWIATDSGLSRFDGARFINYDSRNGLPSPHVTALVETAQGDLLVGTTAGLVRLDLEATSMAKAFVPVATGRTHLGRAGALLAEGLSTWLAETTPAGRLVRLRRAGDSFALEPAKLQTGAPILGITSLARRGTSGVWAGGSGGLIHRGPDGQWQEVPLVRGAALAIDGLLLDDHGRLWIGAARGLFVLNPASPTSSASQSVVLAPDEVRRCPLGVPPSSALPPGAICRVPDLLVPGSEKVTAMVQTGEGAIWVATNQRLWELASGQPRSYTHRNGLFDDAPVSLAEDRDGGLWVGSHDHGLVRIAHHGFVTFTVPGPSTMFAISQILEDAAGRLWVWGKSRTEPRLLVRDRQALEDVTPAVLTAAGDPGRGRHQVVVGDADGELWLASAAGIWHFPKVAVPSDLQRAVRQLSPAPQAMGELVRLFRDSHGQFWVGGLGSSALGGKPVPKITLARWQPLSGQYSPVTEVERLDRGAPSAFVEDAMGNLWIGFSGGGVARLRGSTVDLFLSADGAPPGGINDLLIDASGKLWVASSFGGLSSVENLASPHPRWKSYTAATGLTSDHLLCLTSDRKGLLYLGSGRGVDQLDPRTGAIRALSVADGLPASRVGAAARAGDGRLWFGTPAGLSRYEPEALRREAAPAVLLGSLRIGGIPTMLPPLGTPTLEGLSIAVERNPIEVHLIGISFAYGSSLRYQYRVATTSPWSEPRADHTVMLGNLAAGDYRLEFRALAPDGTVSARPAALGFTLVPPLWRRGWFMVLISAALAALLGAGHRARLGRLLELERVRTRIAADLHDDLGSSLSRISILSELGRRRAGVEDAAEATALEQIGETARELMEATSDIVWAIDARRDDLANLLARTRRFAADLLEPRGVRLVFVPPPRAEEIVLRPETKRELYLVLKEALNNAARHAQAHCVWLEVSADERQLIATVRDDGIGFATASDPDSRRPADTRGGNGLRNIQTRATRLGGTLAVESQPGAGTSVRLSLRR